MKGEGRISISQEINRERGSSIDTGYAERQVKTKYSSFKSFFFISEQHKEIPEL